MKQVCPHCGITVNNISKHLQRERCAAVFAKRASRIKTGGI